MNAEPEIHPCYQQNWSINVLLTIANLFVTSLVVVCLLFSLYSPAGAIEVGGLYQARVEVNSRSNERERQQAFATGLREVLVKVSGRTDVLTSREIRSALASPQSYVEGWAYNTIPVIVNEEITPGNSEVTSVVEPRVPDRIELEISFYEPEILRLLDASNIPVWPANRPETLVWIIVQEELGNKRILSSAFDSDNEILTTLTELAETRGVPVLFPLMDVEDQLKVDRDVFWSLDQEAIRNASARYQSESILVVRLYESLGGELLGKTLYLFRDQSMDLDVFEESMTEFVSGSLNLAAEELSAYYAVLVSGTNTNAVVNMTIEGVNSVTDYAAVLNYVKTLADVSAVQVASVAQQSLVLQLQTGGQLRQLVETIALDRKMDPQAELTRLNNEIYVQYRWRQ